MVHVTRCEITGEKKPLITLTNGFLWSCLKTANNTLRIVVGERGFEPPTHWSQTSCATKLRYSPTGDAVLL